jgi:predicted nucleic acid-binding protein
VVLVDTSIWIEVFRRRRPLILESLVPLEEVMTCLPIVQEVLQGIGDESPFRTAREAMMSLPMLESPMTGEVFDEAVQLYRLARKRGLTVRSSIDCLIAVCALRSNVELLHRDRDYHALAAVSHLRERSA